MTDPCDAWQLIVTVPASLPGQDLDALFTAVADAVHDWEPADRKGWDADICAQRVTLPAERLRNDR